jgi:hypothetical protein
MLHLLCGLANSQDSKADFFEKRIRPILVDRCYECHGPDDASGKLRLDTKAGWVRGGESGPSIVPGDPPASLLYRAVSHTDQKLKMPPPESGKKLSGRQINDLATWIRQGAFDPRKGDAVTDSIAQIAKTHWAFQPIRAPKIDQAQHPIDFLIDKQIKRAGFSSTRAADLRTLIRRATYDLIGLPPTAKQLATSRADFPLLIDELLASPSYGERWARHWLDVARYSDAKDGVLMYGDARIRPFAYTYRDYVIRAFNDDKPFDQFVREQLAADKLGLPKDSPNLAAMGFLTLGRMFDRNPHDIIDDQIDVVTRGFLGLTVTCARCHDHKFDPLPTADYYSLYGVFASSVEPYQRPRIASISEAGKAYEVELAKKLKKVFATEQAHYDKTLNTARDRTPDYLVQVATTQPDISETSIFFLSLLPEQLRPQITYRWRNLIARRAYSGDPIFGPWYDLLLDGTASRLLLGERNAAIPKLQIEKWRREGVDARIIAGLETARPTTPAEIARTYGKIIRGVWGSTQDAKRQLAKIEAEIASLKGAAINLSDVVGGGNGFGTGTIGAGIHPGTGKPTKGQVGFVEIKHHDQLVAVSTNRFVDGVFVPKSESSVISTTGIKIGGLVPSAGQTWDYFNFGPSAGFTVKTIDGVDYSQAPNWMLGMHANKGITFDLQAFRDAYEFETARFKTLLGHGGAKAKSHVDFSVYLDGKRVAFICGFKSQQKGAVIDLELPKDARFLTLVVLQGSDGISHDQAILGNPRVVPNADQKLTNRKKQRLASLQKKVSELRFTIDNPPSLANDPLAQLLVSKESPIWFPKKKIYYYLSRKEKDAFRGLVEQLDAISVKHKKAAARAMVMVDSQSLYEPVIFQRGDPGLRGTPVPRQFLKIASPAKRQPFANGSGRLDLANAIGNPANPLTARVWVNRVWQHHFGQPLVENPSDFGLRTKQPVHHELLDYLATTLIKNAWHTKPLHRLIMTSAAYQRASQIDETDQLQKQLESDPSNNIVWHANRRRLDLEQMRDTMLAISGKLDDRLYGRPGSITDINNQRRTIYSFVERQNIPNVVATFDFANADTSTAQRVNTIVPQQSLYAMNSEFVAKTAKAVAALASAGSDLERATRIYQIVLRRSPTSEEADLALEFVGTNPWHQFAQILLMTNELMFID